MTFDLLQQLRAGQAGGQCVGREVEGIELNQIVMGAIARRRARADVGSGVFNVGPANPLQGRFCTDTGRNMVSGGLDPVMNPVIDTLAFPAVRVVLFLLRRLLALLQQRVCALTVKGVESSRSRTAPVPT
jgi:hypothetical protein